MTRDISIETDLPYPPATVWQALTDPAALSDWLMPVEGFEPMAGTRFRLRAKPMAGWDGVVHCEVVEAVPHTRLSYTWRGSRMRHTTTVLWTLTELDGNHTRLRLDHQGFDGASGALLAFMHKPGWRRFLQRRLPEHLAGRPADRGGAA
jgi:uncharacterized protein YndB with AHSA1/START domain